MLQLSWEGSPGAEEFQLKKNHNLAKLLKYQTQQNIVLSSGKLTAMPLYRLKIHRISNLITKVKNKKIMTAIPYI